MCSTALSLQGSLTNADALTTVEALTKDGNVPYHGQDSGRQKMGSLCVILGWLSLTSRLTEKEIKALPYAEGIVNDGVFT